jgi:hypothetical protein
MKGPVASDAAGGEGDDEKAEEAKSAPTLLKANIKTIPVQCVCVLAASLFKVAVIEKKLCSIVPKVRRRKADLPGYLASNILRTA